MRHAIGIALIAVLAIPFSTVINGTIVADSFSFEIFARNGTLEAGVTRNRARVVPRRSSRRDPLRVQDAPPRRRDRSRTRVRLPVVRRSRPHRQAADGQLLVVRADRDWIDRAKPASSVVLVAGPATVKPVSEWQTEYHNLSIRRLYFTCRATLSPDFNERRVAVGADGVVRSGRREALLTGYAVVPANLGVEGRVLGRDTTARLELVETDGGALRLRVREADRTRWRC